MQHATIKTLRSYSAVQLNSFNDKTLRPRLSTQKRRVTAKSMYRILEIHFQKNLKRKPIILNAIVDGVGLRIYVRSECNEGGRKFSHVDLIRAID